MFITANFDGYLASYSSSLLTGMDLIAISSTEVFYHCYDASNLAFHFIKSTFKIEDMKISEDFNEILFGQNTAFGGMTRVDEDLATLWHATAGLEKIVYFQHNLSDFSIIGSKFAINNLLTNENIYTMDLKNNTLYI